MGPVRKILGAANLERAAAKKPVLKVTPGDWCEKARLFGWHDRAFAWDEYRRKQVYTEGYAYDLTRIDKLNTLAKALEDRITKALQVAKEPKGLSIELVEVYLKTVDGLAQETGGRKKGAAAEVNVNVDNITNNNHRAVFVMPDRGDLADDIEQMTPGQDGGADATTT